MKLLDLSGEIGSSRKARLCGNLFCFIGDLRIKNNHLQFDKNYKDTLLSWSLKNKAYQPLKHNIKPLYINIPDSEAIAEVKQSFDHIFSEGIPTFLPLILTLNNFIINCTSYLQTKSCAMTKICQPPYATIFMTKSETKYIHPFIKHVSITYFRYIDDIFMKRTGN